MGVDILIGLTMAWGVIEGSPYLVGWLAEYEQNQLMNEQLESEEEIERQMRERGNWTVIVQTQEEVEAERLKDRKQIIIKK